MKILHPSLILFCALCFCVVTVDSVYAKKKKNEQKKYRGYVVTKEVKKPPVTDTLIKREDTLAEPVFVSVSEWVGKKFRLLEKTKMFQGFGYELYTTPRFSTDTMASDPHLEHKNHRLKYETFVRRTITATKVDPFDKGEYLITFIADTLGLTVYGKTSKGAIEGIALYTDFEEAEKRWKGKTIFSRRRSIETFDSVASRFSSVKVSAAEPLRVIDIHWGITPLPPKSLWLVIERSDGFRGFIPINYSWTNVIREDRLERLPWEKDIFEKDPRILFKWEPYIWETIDKHNICTGMTTEMVRFSWGEPLEIVTGHDDKPPSPILYKYKGTTLKFINDTLLNAVE